jgi:phosphate transport system substrate-binding protein
MKPFRWLTILCVAGFVPSAAADSLSVVGTGDGMSVLQELARAYNGRESGTIVFVPSSIHSAGGIREVIFGKAVLGRIARPLRDKELGYNIRVTPIFRQAAAFFVNPTAGVKSLSIQQVTDIYAGSVTNWREVGGEDLPIRVVRREDGDSTLGVLRETLPGWKSLKFKERSKLATTTQDSFNTVEMVEGAIGFGPYSRQLEKRFNVLRLDGLYPTAPEYPSTLTISLIHRDATVTKPALEFLDYIFTEEGQKVIHETGAHPIAKRSTN